MSVSKMEKLTVVVPEGDAEMLLGRLMRLGTVSLSREPLPQHTGERLEAHTAEAAARVARIEAVLPLLTKRSRRKKPLFAPTVPFDLAEFKRSGEEARALKTVAEAERILEETEAIKAKIATEQALMQSLIPYLDHKLSLDNGGTKTATVLLGSLPAGIKADKLKALADEGGFVAEILSSDSRGVYVSIVTHRSAESETLKALASLGFLRAAHAKTAGRATDIFDAAQKREQDLRRDMERLDAQFDVLAENLTEVEILYDLAHTALLTEQNKEALLKTKRCAILTGWCPARERERVTQALKRSGAAYEFLPPAEGDDVPVLLQNNGYARNFEWVLGMYSYPKYGKFDPTFVMSIFYFLIFGLMFADAGYGLVLMVACFGAVKWFAPREGMKRFLLMFGYCGISCLIFGVVFGSYFGNFPLAFMENVLKLPPEKMPNLALIPSAEANIAILFDPIQNPMGFLIVSLGVGALHLVGGMAVKAFVLCCEKKPLEALFDIGSYWLLFGGIGAVFFNKTVGLSLIIGGVALVLATQGRAKKGVGGKIIGGLGGLYALIGYASDLLSYSRVLALGLAAGVIAQVVNLLATMKGASFIGFLMMIVIFTVGHLLNLVINVLGTFVHTSRLQYIEFFSRFYEDGGTPFRPMTVSGKYSTELATEEAESEAEKTTAKAT